MSIEDNTLALAGVFQAAELVLQAARQGRTDEEPFLATIHSTLKLEAASTEDVFSGVQGVRLGLQVLLRELGHADHKMEVLRYVFGVMVLERKLHKRPDMLKGLRAGLDRAIIQAETFSITHPNVLASLAGVYTDTLSTFNYRIHVFGEASYLQNPNNINKVRALLLAGIRSAVLWRQKGGGRFQLLWSRRKILRQAEYYLSAQTCRL